MAAPPASRSGPLIPLLMVYDLRRSVAFYCEVLGFEVEASWQPDGHFYWAQLRSGDTRLMLNAEFEDDERRPEHDRPHGKDVTFYFYPEDVAALRTSLVAQGQQPGDLQDAPYGHRQFELRDPDGYKLLFTQPVEATE